jgi:hypothetical protein
LDNILEAINNAKMSFGEMIVLFLTGQVYDGGDEPIGIVKRSHKVTTAVSHFLHGGGRYRVAHMLEGLLNARWDMDHYERGQEYQLDVPYTKLHHSKPTVSSFAAQLVHKRMLVERQTLAKPSSGLHVLATSNEKRSVITWDDIGKHTHEQVQNKMVRFAPLTYNLWYLFSLPKPRVGQKEGRVVAVRTRAGLVATRNISAGLHSHNAHVSLLQVTEGALMLANRVQQSCIAFLSRGCNVSSYSTIYRSLEVLGDRQSAQLYARGQDPDFVAKTSEDNVQHYSRSWDPRAHLKNVLITGMCATQVDVLGPPSAFLASDKISRKQHSKRADLTAECLLEMVDLDHMAEAYALEWLHDLVFYIPRLEPLRKRVVSDMAKTSKSQVVDPSTKTKINTLRSTSATETRLSELKDATYHFWQQLGYEPTTKADPNQSKLYLSGGDGLTFWLKLRLKRLLRLEDTAYGQMLLLHPYLELFHMFWAYLSIIYEAHWGSLTCGDPSTLGHCANKLHFKQPAKLSKVDYYPCLTFAHTVLTAKILDCFR